MLVTIQTISDSEKLRIIEGLSVLEILINYLISKHYFGSINEKFTREILGDESINNGTRMRILGQIVPDAKEFINGFQRLTKIRNTIAHTGRVKVYTGGKWCVIDPRKHTKEKHVIINYQDLLKEYDETYPLVYSFVEKYFKADSGNLIA